jgi:hypothetical protein
MAKLTNGAPPRFFQFAPSADRPNYPGVFGWGFDTHGYRIVVYGPPETDHPVVHEAVRNLARDRRRQHQQDGEDGGLGHPAMKSRNRRQRRDKLLDRHDCPRPYLGGEHPPAHVHVIHIQSGRETRFEFLQHFAGEHTARPFHLSEKRQNILTPAEERAVQPILDKIAPNLIQLWQELYQDSKLSGYVTRISHHDGQNMEETIDADGWVHMRDERGNVARIPPPNSLKDKSPSQWRR